jgi:hypothetical protein
VVSKEEDELDSAFEDTKGTVSHEEVKELENLLL